MRNLMVLLSLLSCQGAFQSSLTAAELSLEAADSLVPLTEPQSTELDARLASYFEACHPYGNVVWGEVLPQEDLEKSWTEQQQIIHALLHVTYGDDAAPHLRNKSLDVLFGFPLENGPGPVLAKDSSQLLTSFIKCPGIEGLLIACHVHGLVPGAKPNPRCQEWADMQALPSTSPAEP